MTLKRQYRGQRNVITARNLTDILRAAFAVDYGQVIIDIFKFVIKGDIRIGNGCFGVTLSII